MNNSGIKVLFISSSKRGRAGDVVLSQGESLKQAGIDVDYFLIKSGFRGYLSSISRIRKTWKAGGHDLVHAHYSLSAFAASAAGRFPLVVSLMGSDVFMSGFLRRITRILSRRRWRATIVKTVEMKERLHIAGAEVVPNGVDLKLFSPAGRTEARSYLEYPVQKILILFISAPGRPEKNLELAEKAIKLLDDPDVDFRHLYNVTRTDIPYWLNAADLLLLTSKYEGSVNVIKEAMACNCPIVSTDVGDVRWVTGDIAGCYITSFDAGEITDAIRKALAFNARTNGRARIISLGLDSESVAMKILSIYERALN
jgi:teichuronic acid biosynthesis glycosyltransferase TuaC